MDMMEDRYSHSVALEEVLEFPLSGRICEVPNVQPTSFISTDGSSIGGGLSCGGSAVGGLGGRDGGGLGVGGSVFNGSRHIDG